MLTYVLLFVGAFCAAALSGAAGFGGALLLLPLLTRTVGPTLAVPLLTLAQLIGNVARMGLGVRQIRWRAVGCFLLGAVPCSILGAWSFVALPTGVITRLLGASILIFVALRARGRLQFTPGPQTLVLGGGIVGALSGLVGSAGPLGAAIFLTLKLPPVTYIASEATTATVLHVVKTIVYQRYIHFDQPTWLLALALGGAMVGGTLAGKRLIERLSAERFRQVVAVLLVGVAMHMIVFG